MIIIDSFLAVRQTTSLDSCRFIHKNVTPSRLIHFFFLLFLKSVLYLEHMCHLYLLSFRTDRAFTQLGKFFAAFAVASSLNLTVIQKVCRTRCHRYLMYTYIYGSEPYLSYMVVVQYIWVECAGMKYFRINDQSCNWL